MPSSAAEKSKKAAVLVAFGQTVRYHRKVQGMSQEAFADKCGIDRSYMGGVERGERNIALINAAKIVDSLGMQLADFFSDVQKSRDHLNSLI